MKTICTEVYQYHELSPAAQEIARQWWTSGMMDDQWWDLTEEDFHAVLKAIGFDDIDSGFSGFWSQGDGAHFTGSWSYNAGWRKALEDHGSPDEAVNAAETLASIARRHFYRTYFTLGKWDHRSVHDGVMRIEHTDRDYSDDDEKAILEACRSLAKWYYRTLEEEYEHQTSPAAIAEAMEANGYTFTADGKRFG